MRTPFQVVSYSIICAGLLAWPAVSRAGTVAPVAAAPAGNVALPAIFGDHMVLQRDTDAPIWGTADAGGSVVVTVAGRTASATANARGVWQVDLRGLPAGGPYTLTVTGQKTIVLGDVLVGDVWLVAGQSNMAYDMAQDPINAGVAKRTNDPDLRIFRVFPGGAPTPQREFSWHPIWTAATPQNVGDWPSITSAVGFYFAEEIRSHEKIPIGIVEAASGSTSGESWLAASALESHPDLLAVANAQLAIARAGDLPLDNYTAGAMSNGMIAPIAGYGITGGLWYQGESNDWPVGHAALYGALLPLLAEDWRARWGWTFPFYIVQLHGFEIAQPHGSGVADGPGDANAPSQLALVREGQLQAANAIPNAYLAVADDLGDPAGDVHPPDKSGVGHRLALIARAQRYHESVNYAGPRFAGATVAGAAIVVRFTHADGGLVAKGGAPQLFAIAGADHRFVWASARIAGDTIVVSSPQVPDPVAVRYAWSDNPFRANVYNGAGLPASPFRTDRW